MLSQCDLYLRTKHHLEILLWSSSSQSHGSDANFKKSVIRTCIEGLVFSNMKLETTPSKPEQRVERTADQLQWGNMTNEK